MSIYKDKSKGCYIFEYDKRIGGQRVRARKALPKSFTKAQAEAYASTETARLYALTTGVTKADEKLIEDAVLVYIKERVPTLKSGENIIRELAQMFHAYRGKPLSQLSQACKDYAGESQGKLAPATIKNRIRYLASACRYAWKHHNYCENDPASGVITPTVKNERHVYIGRPQLIKLLRACEHRPARALLRIAFYSGMRIGEVLTAQIVGDNFYLADTKNGEPRLVPIHPKIRTATRYIGSGITRYIVSYWQRKARAKVGLDGLRIHDLRHSTASALASAGEDLYTIGQVLGHKSIASSKRYTHLTTDRLKNALLKI